MSNQHKHPTISFRISDAERKQIEARILASGMMKKDYFVRSCIYNRICVVGKKETIYPLVQTVNALYLQLLEMQKAFTTPNCTSGYIAFFLADNADAVIDAGTDKVIFFHHATGKDAGFDLFAFSIADSKTYSWMFMLIAHRKAPFHSGCGSRHS